MADAARWPMPPSQPDEARHVRRRPASPGGRRRPPNQAERVTSDAPRLLGRSLGPSYGSVAVMVYGPVSVFVLVWTELRIIK
jgi:hypothetical protein